MARALIEELTNSGLPHVAINNNGDTGLASYSDEITFKFFCLGSFLTGLGASAAWALLSVRDQSGGGDELTAIVRRDGSGNLQFELYEDGSAILQSSSTAINVSALTGSKHYGLVMYNDGGTGSIVRLFEDGTTALVNETGLTGTSCTFGTGSKQIQWLVSGSIGSRPTGILDSICVLRGKDLAPRFVDPADTRIAVALPFGAGTGTSYEYWTSTTQSSGTFNGTSGVNWDWVTGSGEQHPGGLMHAQRGYEDDAGLGAGTALAAEDTGFIRDIPSTFRDRVSLDDLDVTTGTLTLWYQHNDDVPVQIIATPTTEHIDTGLSANYADDAAISAAILSIPSGRADPADFVNGAGYEDFSSKTITYSADKFTELESTLGVTASATPSATYEIMYAVNGYIVRGKGYELTTASPTVIGSHTAPSEHLELGVLAWSLLTEHIFDASIVTGRITLPTEFKSYPTPSLALGSEHLAIIQQSRLLKAEHLELLRNSPRLPSEHLPPASGPIVVGRVLLAEHTDATTGTQTVHPLNLVPAYAGVVTVEADTDG